MRRMRRDPREPHAKCSIYVPDPLLAELQDEAERQQRPLSWLLVQAWTIARARIRSIPSSPARDRRSRAKTRETSPSSPVESVRESSPGA